MADGDLHIGAMAQRFAAADGDAARTPPHNIEAEQALLGALLMNNDAADRVGFLRAGHFYEPVHGRIFEVATTMIRRGQVADAVTCKTYFEADGALAEIGGAQYLAHLAAAATPLMSVEHYGRLVHDLATRRAIIDVAGDALERAHVAALADDGAAMLDGLRAALDGIDADPGGGPTTLDAAVAEALALADTAYKRGGGLAGLSWGFPTLDRLTGGLAPGQNVVLAGGPKSGKTALGWDVALRTALAGIPVLVCSREMAPPELAFRALAAQARIPYSRIRRGDLREPDWPALVAAARALAALPLAIERRANTPGKLLAVARRMQRRDGLGLVVVDYLQRMTTDRPAVSRYERISDVSFGLKELAVGLAVPVLTLCQINRAGRGTGQRPTMGDLEGSGSIEQDADQVILLHREEAYLRQQLRNLAEDTPEHAHLLEKLERHAGKVELICDAVRAGSTGEAVLRLDLPTNRFWEAADDAVPPQQAIDFGTLGPA